MRHSSTPFFSALFPLLFGRPPCRELKNLQTQALGTDSISELRKALGQFVPDALLGRHTQRGRDRLFTPLVTFWAFLSQVLSPQSACRDAVRKAQAWWSLGPPATCLYEHQRLLSGAQPPERADSISYPPPDRATIGVQCPHRQLVVGTPC